MLQRREDRGRIAAGGDGKPGGNECVLDLKLTDQRQPHAKVLAAMFERHFLRETVDDGFHEPDAGAFASDTDDGNTAR